MPPSLLPSPPVGINYSKTVTTLMPPSPQGGINYSNAVTTVSPSFAKEITGGGAAGWLKALFSKPEVGTGVGLLIVPPVVISIDILVELLLPLVRKRAACHPPLTFPPSGQQQVPRHPQRHRL